MPRRLRLENIVKRFGVFTANNGVSLDIEGGTIHAILGENGAGKSTLMNIIYGLYQPDEGEIYSRNQRVRIASPKTALSLGIGMVHQHFRLVSEMTVLENVVLGLRNSLVLHLSAHRASIEKIAQSLGFHIDVDKPIWTLPVGMQQRVEIIKLIYRNADLLILDEPTSVLTPSEIEPFFRFLDKLRAQGTTVILITHKLQEALAIADDISVMRSGEVVLTAPRAATEVSQLTRLMVGRDISPPSCERSQTAMGPPVLQVEKLTVKDRRGLDAVRDLSLTVHHGQIIGIAGVDGNGQAELAEAIAGIQIPTSGSITVGGTDVTNASISERLHRHRIGFVPEDRHRTALDLDSPIYFNFVLRSFGRPPFSRGGWVNSARMKEYAAHLAKAYDVRMRSIFQTIRELSGGNQQKIVLAREMAEDPAVLIVSQATKGLDVGAIDYVHRSIVAQRNRGCAVLYISTELEDVLAIADRVAVIYRGRLVGEFDCREASVDRLGLLMAGVGS